MTSTDLAKRDPLTAAARLEVLRSHPNPRTAHAIAARSHQRALRAETNAVVPTLVEPRIAE